MEIILTESGGFAGIINEIVSKIDTDKIPTIKRKEIKNLIKLSDFFNQKSLIDKVDVIADGFSYKISISDSGITKSVEFYDDENNSEINHLLALKKMLFMLKEEE